VKARVDLAKPSEAPPNNSSRLARSQSTFESGLLALGDGFEQLGPDSAINKGKLISMEILNFQSYVPDETHPNAMGSLEVTWPVS
jgi:hypothetical protein